MNDCASCRYWNKEQVSHRLSLRPVPREGDTPAELERRAHEAESLFGRCMKINLLDPFDRYDDVPLAGTLDGSEFMADLYTQGTFGCVLWEQAE